MSDMTPTQEIEAIEALLPALQMSMQQAEVEIKEYQNRGLGLLVGAWICTHGCLRDKYIALDNHLKKLKGGADIVIAKEMPTIKKLELPPELL